MVSLRLGFVTAAVLASSLLVSAIPVPSNPYTGSPAPYAVEEGSVYRALPSHFEPHHPDNDRDGGAVLHPVVAIGRTSPGGRVPAVAMSHQHPPHMSSDLRPASDYHVHTDHHGHGRFEDGSMAAVGHPVHVHHEDLRLPTNRLPLRLHPEDARRLSHDTAHSTSHLRPTNPGWPQPPVHQQTAHAPWNDPDQRHAYFGTQQHHDQHNPYGAAAYPGHGQHPHQAYGQQQHPHQAYGQQQHPHQAHGQQHAHQAYGQGQQQQHQHAAYPAHAYPQHPQHAAHAPQHGAVYPPGHPYAGYPVQSHSGHHGSNGRRS
ncbi:hypothetical protein CPB84DRAFT_1777939 [Gymnopilus junonius]|uniref:Uncharacterized protein n=1 Tax=Gymnopilus junonius TaxID=109634 RepID=A0A9P5TMC8_GYMJU|nr:hypothetical protein CPB84DRAFT_1777939 [Gymnopilus junonius]